MSFISHGAVKWTTVKWKNSQNTKKKQESPLFWSFYLLLIWFGDDLMQKLESKVCFVIDGLYCGIFLWEYISHIYIEIYHTNYINFIFFEKLNKKVYFYIFWRNTDKIYRLKKNIKNFIYLKEIYNFLYFSDKYISRKNIEHILPILYVHMLRNIIMCIFIWFIKR